MRNSIASCRSICVQILWEKSRATASMRPYYTRSVGLPSSCIVGAGLAPALVTGCPRLLPPPSPHNVKISRSAPSLDYPIQSTIHHNYEHVDSQVNASIQTMCEQIARLS